MTPKTKINSSPSNITNQTSITATTAKNRYLSNQTALCY